MFVFSDKFSVISSDIFSDTRFSTEDMVAPCSSRNSIHAC